MTQRTIIKLSNLVYHFLSTTAKATNKRKTVARNKIAARLYSTFLDVAKEHLYISCMRGFQVPWIINENDPGYVNSYT